MKFTATGRSTAHTKCRNEVEDLERSVKLCGRAVADNWPAAREALIAKALKLLTRGKMNVERRFEYAR
jgi:hypothetical protein